MAKPTTSTRTESAARGFISTDPAAAAGYLSLRAAAKLIGKNPSVLSRRRDLVRESVGQEQRIPSAEVIRLASVYRSRPLSSVAGELVARAAVAGPEVQRLIADEVDGALEWFSDNRRDDPHDAFIAEAYRRLPPELAQQVERTLSQEKEAVAGFVGWAPDDD